MKHNTTVETKILTDPRLSFKAKGIYSVICYLRQRHGIEYPTIGQIHGHSKDGKAAVISGITELKEAGILPPKPPHSSMQQPGFVYFIQTEKKYEFQGQLTKIGASKNPAFRAMQLEKELGENLIIAYQHPVQNMGKAESDLHCHFYRERIKGEWFRLTPLDIRNAVNLLES